jgi:hypothetical protein
VWHPEKSGVDVQLNRVTGSLEDSVLRATKPLGCKSSNRQLMTFDAGRGGAMESRPPETGLVLAPGKRSDVFELRLVALLFVVASP